MLQNERLIVQNFYSLEEIDIEFSRYNIIIGEQASGKSLLLKLVYFFRDTLSQGFVVVDSTIQIEAKIYLAFKRIFPGAIPNKEWQITYIINNYSITLSNNHVHYSDNIKEIFLLLLDKKHIEESTNIYLDAMNHSLSSRIFGCKPYTKLTNYFIPAARSSLHTILNNSLVMMEQSSYQSVDKLLLRFGAIYQQEKNLLSTLANNVLDSEFEKKSREVLKGKLSIKSEIEFIDNDKYSTNILYASSGQQEFLPIYLILNRIIRHTAVNSNSILIEEPEAHLYPSSQKLVIELLILATNINSNNNLYMTTHSPYLLTVINNLFLAKDISINNEASVKHPEQLLLSFDETRAYFINNGKAYDLRDKDLRLIIAEDLDKVSIDTSAEFDEMLDIKYKNEND